VVGHLFGVAAVAVPVGQAQQVQPQEPLLLVAQAAQGHLRLELLERSPLAVVEVLEPAAPALAALAKSSSPSSRRKERSCQFLL
jgi:hypothetical protein